VEVGEGWEKQTKNMVIKIKGVLLGRRKEKGKKMGEGNKRE
jgi:hypothetical protein